MNKEIFLTAISDGVTITKTTKSNKQTNKQKTNSYINLVIVCNGLKASPF